MIPQRKTFVFILRIWAEYLANDPSDLRGEIEDVSTHEKHFFANFAELEHLLHTKHLEDYSYGHTKINGTSK